MHPVSLHARLPRGFTLVEALVALSVFAVMLAVGVPRMVDWVAATKAAAATQFYAEGMGMARAKALALNSASRLVLTRNEASGQFDWQVDVCFPTPETPCSADAGEWSTVDDAVKPESADGDGFTSIARSAESLPDTNRLAVSTGPDGALEVYFTPLGWVDTLVEARMMRIDLDPVDTNDAPFRPSSVVLTLAGVAATCDPNAAADDSRRCPE